MRNSLYHLICALLLVLLGQWTLHARDSSESYIRQTVFLDSAGTLSYSGASDFVTTFTDNRSIEYVYSSDGTKLRTIHEMPGLTAWTHYGGAVVLTWRRDTTEYIGNLIVKNSHPEMLRFDGGYASFSNDTIDGLHYYIQDYQGNNRMVVNKDGAIEQVTHYYPYGGVIGDISTNESLQKYKFEGKELDRTFGLDNYDIQARQYFAMAPMWDRIDPLATKSPGISPYAFCNGDPVNHIDKDGKWAETLWDVANVVMDVKSAYVNFSNGNTRAGLVDVGAGIVDGLAAVLPIVPAGAGTALKAARAAGGAVEAVKSADKGVDAIRAIDNATDGSQLLRKAPPANGGKAKPHGGKKHNAEIDSRIEGLPDGSKHIRKNQVQVDVEGYRVGNNRPDLQYDYKGKHHNEEFDTNKVQMGKHIEIVTNNDPNAVNEFFYIGK